MGALCFINPSENLTLSRRENMRVASIVAGIEHCYEKSIGSRDDIPGLSAGMDRKSRINVIRNFLINEGPPKSLDIREVQPLLDAGTALDRWQTAAMAVVGTAYSCFQAIPAPVNPANRVIVFYKVGIETAPSPVSRLIFRSKKPPQAWTPTCTKAGSSPPER